MSNNNHYIAIHGHFYQPPRENPWLGIIEQQEGAEPFHDWNERIAAECYTACARARIHDAQRQIDRLANNFINISFNIGPTLFDWMERYHPNTVKRIIAADKKSAERLDGHGNAIAQVYNHMIMPLCSDHDRYTQVAWGLYDFKSRFGRDSEGIWLAECAVDQKTINCLIESGVKFIILAPTQAKRYRALNEDTWHDVEYNSFDTRFPYRVYKTDDSNNKIHDEYIDVFFYDGGISNGIAFNHLLRSADKMLAKFEEDFDADAIHPQLVSAATDGESYGHHEPYGEMCLAYFFEELVKKKGQTIINYAHFLSLVESGFEVELSTGDRGEGSSWSCSHGVGRWYYNCGCKDGGYDGWSQEWRTPFRNALNDLKSVLDNIFENEGGKVFDNPWEARNEYISVIRNHSKENREKFLKEHAPVALENGETEEKVWNLLEMQKHGMFMFTSCGWFFADIGGVEPVQNMRYALRAIEHASGFTDEDLELRLLNHLEQAKSNDPAKGSGGAIFRKYVKPSVFSNEKIAACYAMFEMYKLPQPGFNYKAHYSNTDSVSVDGIKVLNGIIELEDFSINKFTKFVFFVAHISDREAACVMKKSTNDFEADEFIKDFKKLSGSQLSAKLVEEGFLIRDMPQEQRSLLLQHVLSSRLSEVNHAFSEKYDTLKPLLGILSENDINAPEVLKVASEFVLSERFASICKGIAKNGRWDENAAVNAKSILEEADLYKLKIDRKSATPIMADFILSYMNRLTIKLELSLIEEVTELVVFCNDMGFFFENGGKIENNYWYILRNKIVPLINKLNNKEITENSSEEIEGHELVKRIYNLGRALNFSEQHMNNLLEYMKHAEPDEGEL